MRMPLEKGSRYFNILHCNCLRTSNILARRTVIFPLSILLSEISNFVIFASYQFVLRKCGWMGLHMFVLDIKAPKH